MRHNIRIETKSISKIVLALKLFFISFPEGISEIKLRNGEGEYRISLHDGCDRLVYSSFDSLTKINDDASSEDSSDETKDQYNMYDISDYSFIEFTENYGEKCLLIGKIGDKYDEETKCYDYQSPLVLLKLKSKSVELLKFDKIDKIIQSNTRIIHLTSIQLSNKDPFSHYFFFEREASVCHESDDSFVDHLTDERKEKSILWRFLDFYGRELDHPREIVLTGKYYELNEGIFNVQIDIYNDINEDLGQQRIIYSSDSSQFTLCKIWSIGMKDKNKHNHNYILDLDSHYEQESWDVSQSQLRSQNPVGLLIKEEEKEQPLEFSICTTKTGLKKRKQGKANCGRKRKRWNTSK